MENENPALAPSASPVFILHLAENNSFEDETWETLYSSFSCWLLLTSIEISLITVLTLIMKANSANIQQTMKIIASDS